MNTKNLEKIRKRFTYPPENLDKLINLWKEDKPISFYSWECPPRQVQEDEKNGRWANFDVDIEKVVQGKKLDKFTELPRLTFAWKKEKWFIENVIRKNPKASYTKLIADTNGLYLYIKSKKILGEKRIISLSKKFKKLIEGRSRELLGENSPKIILYTDLQNNFKNEYEEFFNLVYKSLEKKNQQLISQDLVNYWKERLIVHIGLDQKDRSQKLDILKRVIASYASEGMVFSLLDQKGIMPNPVWVNWEEKPESVQTTEILRGRYGIACIPVIYFV